VWSGTQEPEFQRNLQTSSSIPQMEGVDSPEVLLPVLQAAVTQCSLPSETQIWYASALPLSIYSIEGTFRKIAHSDY
jgi:hypothetical protein